MWKLIIPSNIIFTLIDFQTSFSQITNPQIYKEVRSNIMVLIKMFKQMRVPMIGTEQYRKGLGATDELLTSEWGDAQMIEKMTFSCWGAEPFATAISSHSRPIVILTGLEAHICVLQTALDLLDQNFKVIVPIDAVLSSTKTKWKNGLELMKEAGVKLLNTETLLFYLLKRADSSEFKYLAKLLKEKK